MREQLEALREEGLAEVAAAASVEDLAAVEVGLLGRSGRLTILLKGVGKLEPAERPLVGKLANEVKQALSGSLATREEELRGAQLAADLAEGQPRR